MKKTTRWSPDTCDGIFDYEWDTDDAPETRAHTFVAVVKHASEHPATDGEAHFDAVLAENQFKNRSIKHVLEIEVSLQPTDIKFSFTDKRDLILQLPDSVNMSAVQEYLDIKEGSGKVAVEALANG